MSLLVALDFSSVSDDQLEIVGRLAAPNREIYLLHVAEPNPDFIGFEAGPEEVRDQVAREFHQEHEQIQSMAVRLRDVGHEVSALLVQGPTISFSIETWSSMSRWTSACEQMVLRSS